MYSSFRVENFRCFQKLSLSPLARINLVAGINNVGKTALLEAIFLHGGCTNPNLSLKLNAFRGIEKFQVELGKWSEYPWVSLFPWFDHSKLIRVESDNGAEESRSLILRAVTDPSELSKLSKGLEYDLPSAGVVEFTYENGKKQERSFYLILDQKGLKFQPPIKLSSLDIFFLSSRKRPTFEEEAELYGKLVKQGKQEIISRALKIIEPRLQGLDMIYSGGQPILHGNLGSGQLLQLPLMGEGMARLLSIVVRIGNSSGGISLIDEIENGLHYSVLGKVWETIGEAARLFNTQIFATTHSRECIVAAHQAFSKSSSGDFRFHRLDRVKGEIKAISYDQDSLAASLDMNLEVR